MKHRKEFYRITRDGQTIHENNDRVKARIFFQTVKEKEPEREFKLFVVYPK